MASKVRQKVEKLGTEASETLPDRPLLELSDAVIKALIRTAKRCGFVTHDQITALLASDEVNSEQGARFQGHIAQIASKLKS